MYAKIFLPASKFWITDHPGAFSPEHSPNVVEVKMKSPKAFCVEHQLLYTCVIIQ